MSEIPSILPSAASRRRLFRFWRLFRSLAPHDSPRPRSLNTLIRTAPMHLLSLGRDEPPAFGEITLPGSHCVL